MNTTFPSTSFSNYRISRFHCTVPSLRSVPFYSCTPFQRKSLKIYASSSEVDAQPLEETKEEQEAEPRGGTKPSTSSAAAPLDKDLKKVGFSCFHSSGSTLNCYMNKQFFLFFFFFRNAQLRIIVQAFCFVPKF